jgi:hypothetical protein
VAEKGDITLALVGFRLRTEKEPPLAQAEAHGTTFTLSGEGRVKRINEKLTVPPEFETHLRFVFGSGIHARPLEEKHVYRLAPLLAAAELEPIHLRFEGLVVEEDEELARFIVVEGPGVAPEPRHAEPDAPRALRVVATAEATSSTTPGFTTPERASIRASGQEWTAVGEATYRTADGVLEAARLEGRSTDRAPNEPELAKLSIRRIFIGRVGKTSSGSEGPLGIR